MGVLPLVPIVSLVFAISTFLPFKLVQKEKYLEIESKYMADHIRSCVYIFTYMSTCACVSIYKECDNKKFEYFIMLKRLNIFDLKVNREVPGVKRAFRKLRYSVAS